MLDKIDREGAVHITSTMHCIFLGKRTRKGGPELG